jgi:hypothetical protein
MTSPSDQLGSFDGEKVRKSRMMLARRNTRRKMKAESERGSEGKKAEWGGEWGEWWKSRKGNS